MSYCTSEQKQHNNGDLLYDKNERIGSVATHSFNERRTYDIPNDNIGLDSTSSVSVFEDRRLLDNIRETNGEMRIQCNAGEVVVTQVGDRGGYDTVLYHPDAIVNILLLSRVRRRYMVTNDGEQEDMFTIHRASGTACEFRPAARGLYASQFIVPHVEVAMVSTVAENEKFFTRKERKAAKKSRRLMAKIGSPSKVRMGKMIGERQLRNCNITE